MESVLVEGRSVGIPCSRLIGERLGITSILGRTLPEGGEDEADVRNPKTTRGMACDLP
jgi:hypothetical protein